MEAPKKIKLPPLKKKGRSLSELDDSSLTAALFYQERLNQPAQAEQPADQPDQADQDNAPTQPKGNE